MLPKINLEQQYFVSLDSLDLTFLHQYIENPNDGERLLWSVPDLEESESKLYEVKLVTEEVDENRSYIESSETVMCYICNIDVPRIYFKQHDKSEMHKNYTLLLKKVLENICKQYDIKVEDNKYDNDECEKFYCETCSKVVLVTNRRKHLKSDYHLKCKKNQQKVDLFIKLYTKQHEDMSDTDSINCTKCYSLIEKDIDDCKTESSIEFNWCYTDSEHSPNSETTSKNTDAEYVESPGNIENNATEKNVLQSLEFNFDDCLAIVTSEGDKEKINMKTFHSYFEHSNLLFCQLCDEWLHNDIQEHSKSKEHLMKIAEPIMDDFTRAVLNKSTRHCLLCNLIVNTDTHYTEFHKYREKCISNVCENEIDSNLEPNDKDKHINSCNELDTNLKSPSVKVEINETETIGDAITLQNETQHDGKISCNLIVNTDIDYADVHKDHEKCISNVCENEIDSELELNDKDKHINSCNELDTNLKSPSVKLEINETETIIDATTSQNEIQHDGKISCNLIVNTDTDYADVHKDHEKCISNVCENEIDSELELNDKDKHINSCNELDTNLKSPSVKLEFNETETIIDATTSQNEIRHDGKISCNLIVNTDTDHADVHKDHEKCISNVCENEIDSELELNDKDKHINSCNELDTNLKSPSVKLEINETETIIDTTTSQNEIQHDGKISCNLIVNTDTDYADVHKDHEKCISNVCENEIDSELELNDKDKHINSCNELDTNLKSPSVKLEFNETETIIDATTSQNEIQHDGKISCNLIVNTDTDYADVHKDHEKCISNVFENEVDSELEPNDKDKHINSCNKLDTNLKNPSVKLEINETETIIDATTSQNEIQHDGKISCNLIVNTDTDYADVHKGHEKCISNVCENEVDSELEPNDKDKHINSCNELDTNLKSPSVKLEINETETIIDSTTSQNEIQNDGKISCNLIGNTDIDHADVHKDHEKCISNVCENEVDSELELNDKDKHINSCNKLDTNLNSPSVKLEINETETTVDATTLQNEI